ncbi:cryptochrome/photolyase family protein [Paracraurococcus ruber]|uniref:Cryptochrome/photolyase family protein n=1 Tax=Paracraurococcus ruber TaxID=77675 RepID=A0ABS1D3E5_9PROT|nr:cryptochrome/photolyase family protein [Paracraurococcus ruber]MBK1660966.1 cryptochrome/photolyase family protein [Paracraurococcus ruber]TDG28585.1 cryptochrome/photolyase family protein [Paracraurococcus ruber]
MPGTLRVVLGDQCSRGLASLRDLDPARDVVLLAEVRGECTYVRHHKQKIVLVLSAMRHFAKALAARGVTVDYIRLDDPANTGTLAGEVARAAARHRPDAICCTHPGEWRVQEDMRGWEAATGIPVEIREDDRFLCDLGWFRRWAQGKDGGKKQLRMEFFYREMRKQTGFLMEDASPAGGAWNYDAENRKRLGPGIAPPPPRRFPPDAITREVMALVEARFPGHFGSLEGFAWPVTAQQAEQALADFITHRLADFGDYQDAMATGEPVLFHALVSTSLNTGLLLPRQCCEAAEAALRQAKAPLNAVEGFIRQILGWREYVRGIYWLKMPDYAGLNALEATRPLPWFFWSGETRLNCLRQAIAQTRDLAYAHHIQRLMVTGNFALIAGLDPAQVNEWYMVVYADAFEWVELPNTHGMVLHADGGMLASKPYAASGAYINRMSDYCRGCDYDVKQSTGPTACPMNALYWDFIARHDRRFGSNPRMAMPLNTLRKMAPERVAALRATAQAFLAGPEMAPEP